MNVEIIWNLYETRETQVKNQWNPDETIYVIRRTPGGGADWPFRGDYVTYKC